MQVLTHTNFINCGQLGSYPRAIRITIISTTQFGGFQRGTQAVAHPDWEGPPLLASLYLRTGVLGFALRFSTVFFLHSCFALNLGLNPRCVYHSATRQPSPNPKCVPIVFLFMNHRARPFGKFYLSAMLWSP